MAVRGRVWRVGKWAGLVSTLLVAGAWVSSVAYSIGFSAGPHNANYAVLRAGDLNVVYHPVDEASFFNGWTSVAGWHVEALEQPNFFHRLGYRERGAVWPQFTRSYYSHPRARVHTTYVIIPLWIVFVVVVIPTAYCWLHEWRRIPAGHCGRCGYDLTKNESGVCPECGREIESQKNSPIEPAEEHRVV